MTYEYEEKLMTYEEKLKARGDALIFPENKKLAQKEKEREMGREKRLEMY